MVLKVQFCRYPIEGEDTFEGLLISANHAIRDSETPNAQLFDFVTVPVICDAINFLLFKTLK